MKHKLWVGLFLVFAIIMLFAEPVSAAPSDSANQILRNLTQELQRIEGPTLTIIQTVGIIIMVGAMMTFVTQYQKMGAGLTAAMLATSMLVGSLFLNLKFFMHLLSYTGFGTSSIDQANAILSYSAPSSDPWSDLITFSVLCIMFVGTLGIVHGAYLLKVTGGQQGHRGRAATLLAGGTLGVNFPTFMQYMGESFGGSVGNTINKIFGI